MIHSAKGAMIIQIQIFI